MSRPKLQHLAAVERLLAEENTLALATSGADAAAHVAPVYYLQGERLRLYWLSSRSSRHSQDLRTRPEAAVTVYRATTRWQQICGVQMHGRVEAVGRGGERDAVVRAYTARFELEPLVLALVARSTLYRFEPYWVRYLDNSRRLGFQVEFRLNED